MLDVLLHFSFAGKIEKKKLRFLLGFVFVLGHLTYANNFNWFNSSVLLHPCRCIWEQVFYCYGYCCIQVDKFSCIVVARGESHCICLEFRWFFFSPLYVRSTNDYVTVGAQSGSYPHCNAFQFDCLLWCWCCCWIYCWGKEKTAHFLLLTNFNCLPLTKRHKSLWNNWYFI